MAGSEKAVSTERAWNDRGKSHLFGKETVIVLALCLLLAIGAIIIYRLRAGWLASYVTLVVFYGIIGLALYTCGFFKRLKALKAGDVLVLVLSAAIFLYVCHYILAQEKFVYYWDYASYWYKTLELFGRFRDSAFSALNGFALLYKSINASEYNYLLAYIIAIPLKLMGGSYLSFEMLVFTIFIVPLGLVLGVFTQELAQVYGWRPIRPTLIFVASLLFPMFFLPLLDGYIDGAVLLPIAICYYLSLGLYDEFSVKKSILLGVMLAIVLTLRRYYAYWVLGFVVYAAAVGLIKIFVSERKIRASQFKRFLGNYALAAMVAIVLLLSCCSGMLGMMLTNDYSVAYSGYNATDLLGKIKEFYGYIKAGIFALMLASVLGDALNIKRRNLCIPLLLSIIISCGAFYLTQNMGIQHYNIVAVPVFLLVLAGVLFLINLPIEKLISSSERSSSAFRSVIVSLFALLVLANFAKAVPFIDLRNFAKGIVIGRTYYIKNRTDLAELHALDDYLASLPAATDEGGVYILASSCVLNYDIMHRVNAPDLSARYSLLTTADVDLRDGFPYWFFDASVVVVGDPVQTHLPSPDSQRVITLLSEGLLDADSVIAGNYVEDASFDLDNDVVVRVFIRVNPYTDKQINSIRVEYETHYSDYPELFADRFEEYLSR